jgi:hypothetical protein
VDTQELIRQAYALGFERGRFEAVCEYCNTEGLGEEFLSLVGKTIEKDHCDFEILSGCKLGEQ